MDITSTYRHPPDNDPGSLVLLHQERALDFAYREIGDYDAYCKRQLSRKPVLARLLKDCLPEFDGFSVQDIERDFLLSPSPNPPAPHSAANTPDGSSYVMEPSDTQPCENLDELVQSLSTDFSLPYVGKAVLDLVFRVKLPSSKASGAVIVNIEPQDNWNPSYPLMARAAFYCARLLSAQQGTEFERSHYGNLKKVYSIWVLTHPPRALKGTITRTEVQWKPVVGEAEHAIGRLLGTFDYSRAAVVGLNGYDMGEYGCVIPLLDALLSKDMEADQRLHIIRDEYRIADSEMEREARLMGSLGTQIALRALREGLEKGVAEGVAKGETSSLLKSITSLTKTLGLSREQAMDALEVPKEERPRYNSLLDDKNK